MMNGQTIRTVLFKEGDWWVAQCLDVDIAAQAKTERELRDELGRVLVGRIMAGEKLGVDPFATLPPAPRRYWEMFFSAQSQPKMILPFMTQSLSRSLPEVELRAC